MAKLSELLLEIVAAGKVSELPLDMNNWHCGTACCLCGDVAVVRNAGTALGFLSMMFSDELDTACEELFDLSCLAISIYSAQCCEREKCADYSGLLTEEQLNHPHLTTNHNDRAIAHDYILNSVLPIVLEAENKL